MLILQKIITIFLLFSLSSLVFASNFDDFNQFDQFDKQDKQEFNRLKSKAKSCMNSWDFSCAEDSISKMKKYITLKKDNKIISSLWDDLEIKKREKERYEEAQRQANSSESVSVTNCYDIDDGQTMCKLYINGSQDGNIFYYYKDNGYVIYISGSSKAEANGGGYNPSLNYIYTANCGNSPLGSVNSISQALEMYANCSVNGHY